MKTLLFVDCCIRREASRTRKLAEAFLNNLPEGWRVEKVTLMDEPLLPLMEGGFAQREELLQRGDFAHRRFDYAWQFQKADAILTSPRPSTTCPSRPSSRCTSRTCPWTASPSSATSGAFGARAGPRA